MGEAREAPSGAQTGTAKGKKANKGNKKNDKNGNDKNDQDNFSSAILHSASPPLARR